MSLCDKVCSFQLPSILDLGFKNSLQKDSLLHNRAKVDFILTCSPVVLGRWLDYSLRRRNITCELWKFRNIWLCVEEIGIRYSGNPVLFYIKSYALVPIRLARSILVLSLLSSRVTISWYRSASFSLVELILKV